MQKRKFAQRALVAAAVSMMTLNAYAVLPGFYLGLGFGPATNAGKQLQAQVMNSTATTTVTPRSQVFGSRLYMGYKMNNWAAVEGGLTYFSNLRFKQKDQSVQTCGGLSASVKDLDVVAKGSFTFYSFELFGKAGAAVVYNSSSGAFNPGTGTTPGACGRSVHTTQFSPVYGIGASYDLTQSVAVDASVTRVNGGNIAGNIDFYALGLSYHFVNVYCGQFLCD